MSIFSGKHSFLVFFTLIAGMSVTFLDQTIVPVALPVIQRELMVSENVLYWIVNCYFLSAATLFILGGKYADGIGHRGGFLLGTAVFSFASLFCGFSTTGLMLCIGRLLQGAAVAMVVPSVTSLILEIFPSNMRGKAMGTIMGVCSIFLLLGPFLGGILSQFFSWRYIFFVNIPICLFAFFGAWAVFPKTKPHPQHVDIPSFMLLVLSMLSLIYPIMEVHVWGWSSVKFWVLLLTASVFIGLLYTLSKRDEHPLIDVSLFQARKFSGVVIIVFFLQFSLSLIVFWPIYFQKILGFSPAITGMITLLTVVPIIIFSPVTGRLVDKYGSYTPAKYGFFSLAFSLVWSIFAFPSLNTYLIVFGMFFLGIGITMVSISTSIFGLGAVDPRKKGVASGIYSTTRYVGLSIGIACMSTLISTFQKILFKVNLQYYNDTTSLNPSKLLGIYMNDSTAIDYVDSLGSTTQEHIYSSLHTATAYSYSIGMLIILGGITIGFAALHKFFRPIQSQTVSQ